MANVEFLQNVWVSCQPNRGWVTVRGHLVPGLQFPVVELTLLTQSNREVASTMIVDAPPEFQMTLHPRDVTLGDHLKLRVEVIQGDHSLGVREYDFQYAPGQEP